MPCVVCDSGLRSKEDFDVLRRSNNGEMEVDVKSPFTAPVVPGKAVRNWETLVLFAVNLSQLDVMVNMSNVMGNTT